MIDSDDRDAMRTYIEAADRYFRELEQPYLLFAKPYVPRAHAGYNVVRLGYLLHHLQLSPAQTVLDFGAGMGWLTIAILKSGCRAIALDVSKAALDLAGRAIDEAALPAGTPEARLVTYDGFRFPLPDASVDRVACYDALHHVPNKRTVLREMFRVLRDGGRAAFVEPGPGHADSAEAAHDTQAWGVLEDEIDAQALCAVAKDVGFSEAYATPLPSPDDNRQSPEAYARLRAGARTQVLDWTGNDALIVLIKPGTPDSRSPRVLAADLDVLACPDVVEPAALVDATVRVTNVGDTRWVALPPEGLDYHGAFLAKTIAPHSDAHLETLAAYTTFIEARQLQGMVTLGARLWRCGDVHVLDRDYARGFLPHDLAPGESADLLVRMRAPATPGLYGIAFDPVDEYITWFSPEGQRAVTHYLRVGRTEIRDSRHPGVLRARLRASASSAPGTVMVEIENTGDTIWLHRPIRNGGWVRVGIQRCDAHGHVVDRDWRRVPLPKDVSPGESVTLHLGIRDDDTGAAAPVLIDLVDELRTWFADAGSEPVRIG